MLRGRILSTKALPPSTISSPSDERILSKIFRADHSSMAIGRTMASMYAIPATASGWRLAQSKASAEPQS